MAPEDSPADDRQPTREEWDEWERLAQIGYADAHPGDCDHCHGRGRVFDPRRGCFDPCPECKADAEREGYEEWLIANIDPDDFYEPIEAGRDD